MATCSTWGLGSGDLAALLTMASEDVALVDLADDASTGVILREHLRQSAADEPGSGDSVPAILDRMSRELGPLGPGNLQAVLTDPRTDLGVLRSLKEHAKGLVETRPPGPRRAAATTIYFASIANALVSHRQIITAHTCEKLASSFGTLVAKSWMPAELRELFERARNACSEKGGSIKSS